MDSQENRPSDVPSNIKTVRKTDACTSCYSKICNTCQIRQDFVFHEKGSKTKRSELFVDEIYTCNKCEHTWMDLFCYCFNCNKLVCRCFEDKHDECNKIFGLMKSDVIKRRRAVETEDDVRKFELKLEKDKRYLQEISEKHKNSTFLTALRNYATTLISKVEELVQSYTSESEMYQKQLSGIDNYLTQQMESFQMLKRKYENIKQNLTFPVSFLLELTEFEKTFKRMVDNHAQLDMSSVGSASAIELICKPIEFDKNNIDNLLGIHRTGKAEVTDKPPRPYSNHSFNDGWKTASNNPTEERNDSIMKKQTKCSTLPHIIRNSNESAWYKISKLEADIKSKDEEIQTLLSKLATAKKQLHLLQCSRNGAKQKISLAEKEVQEMKHEHEAHLKRLDEHHETELMALSGSNRQLEEQIKEMEFAVEKERKEKENEKEDLIASHCKVMHSLRSEVEFLQQEVHEKEDACQKLQKDMDTLKQKAEETIVGYKTDLKRNLELLEIQQLQIEGLQEHTRLLEKERNGEFSDKLRCKVAEEENQKIKQKLTHVKKMFSAWTESSNSLNSMMYHELNRDDTSMEISQEDNPNSQSENTFLKNMNNESKSDLTDDTTKTLQDDDNGNYNKNITSVTYNAKEIHVIQYSQVSLADSGCDTRSVFEGADNTYNY